MTTSVRKFHKTTFKIVVLSEERVPDDIELPDLIEEMSAGAYSGDFSFESEEVLDAPAAAKALEEQASSPEFFGLTSDGEEIN